jgi:diacylglycerol kinase (ATP)
MQNEKGLKTYVVHNPVSGMTDAESVEKRLHQVLDEQMIPFEIYQTTGKEDMHGVVTQAIQLGFQRFIAIGGDGTVSGVASGLVHTDLPLIIIPTGTVNALARELEIPIGTDASLNWWIDNTRIRAIDVIQIRERFYLLNVSVGTTASIMTQVKREDIHRFGVLPYIREALRRSTIPVYRFYVTVDGRSTSFRASEIFIANSGMLLGLKALQLDPDIALDNGKLSICHARLRSIFDYVRIVFKIAVIPVSENEDFDCMDMHCERSALRRIVPFVCRGMGR